jgi:hypothetical protein
MDFNRAGCHLLGIAYLQTSSASVAMHGDCTDVDANI